MLYIAILVEMIQAETIRLQEIILCKFLKPVNGRVPGSFECFQKEWYPKMDGL